LAVNDPVKLLFLSAGHYAPVDISFLFLVLVFFSLFPDQFKRYFIIILLFGIAVSWLGFNLSQTTSYFLKVIVYSGILVVFLLRMSKFLVQTGNINLFYVVLILYMLTIILKYITVIFDLSTGVIYFYLTSAFQILIALFFILYNIKDSKLQLYIKGKPPLN
jgi:hypothetical protein